MTDEPDRNEPLDPDTDPRHPFGHVALVALGGGIGTTFRYLLSATIPDIGGLAFGIFVINMLGAFLLGWLLELLARHGPDTGRRREARLFMGTGVIGGFTTYSAFATDTAALFHAGAVTTALGYGVGTVALGVGATAVGVMVGRRVPRRIGDHA